MEALPRKREEQSPIKKVTWWDAQIAPDGVALADKVLLSLLLLPSAWKTTLRGGNMENNLNWGGRRKKRSSRAVTVKEEKENTAHSKTTSCFAEDRKREREDLDNNLLTYRPLCQTSATTPWLTQESSISAELPMSFSEETSDVLQADLQRGTAVRPVDPESPKCVISVRI